MTSPAFEPTDRTTVRRHRDRGHYDADVVHAILDEGLVCHLACAQGATPWMLPTAYGRRGSSVFVHGAAANHLLKSAAGAEVVVTVTLLDGLVLARSTFNHSMNYRSVVIFGTALEVTDPADKAAALEVIVDHLLPGRSQEARPPTPTELRSTRVLEVPITEVSAKVRTGPSIDDPEDLALPVWAGVLPLRTVAGPASADPGADGVPSNVDAPRSLHQPERWALS